MAAMDPLHRRLVTSNGACSIMKKWAIRETHSARNVQVTTCIASAFVLMAKQNKTARMRALLGAPAIDKHQDMIQVGLIPRSTGMHLCACVHYKKGGQ
jgi:hypothetical protein